MRLLEHLNITIHNNIDCRKGKDIVDISTRNLFYFSKLLVFFMALVPFTLHYLNKFFGEETYIPKMSFQN